jgi:large subunit ribosomal protein L15
MLHLLKPASGSRKRRKRVGRGDSSGHGKTATRGAKGQKARTGGKRGLGRFAVRGAVLRIPKKRGFTSPTKPLAAVTLAHIVAVFPTGTVTPRQLVKAGLVDSIRYGVKVIGVATLTQPLIVQAHRFSRTAKAALTAAKGKATILPLRRNSS